MSAPLPSFRIGRPRDIADAIAMRREHPESRFIAGGTDLLVNVRHGIGRPDLLIDLSRIDELARLQVDDRGALVGAGVTIAALARNPVVAARYRAVHQAAQSIAGPGHRTLGTVGGNLCLDTRCIYYNQSEWWRRANGYCLKHEGDVCHVAPQGSRCHAAFTGDLAPGLIALGADVEIAGPQGRRRIALGELYREDGRNHLALAGDEIVVAVRLPPQPPPSSYAKLRLRGAVDYPLAGVAVALAAAESVVTTLHVGLTGTNARPFLLAGTDKLVGRPLDGQALRDLDRLIQTQVQPMRTTIVSAHYRRVAIAALTCRLARELFAVERPTHAREARAVRERSTASATPA
jgi:4-hydroxybenzoyl-CoA reductase subunit beta